MTQPFVHADIVRHPRVGRIEPHLTNTMHNNAYTSLPTLLSLPCPAPLLRQAPEAPFCAPSPPWASLCGLWVGEIARKSPPPRCESWVRNDEAFGFASPSFSSSAFDAMKQLVQHTHLHLRQPHMTVPAVTPSVAQRSQPQPSSGVVICFSLWFAGHRTGPLFGCRYVCMCCQVEVLSVMCVASSWPYVSLGVHVLRACTSRCCSARMHPC